MWRAGQMGCAVRDARMHAPSTHSLALARCLLATQSLTHSPPGCSSSLAASVYLSHTGAVMKGCGHAGKQAAHMSTRAQAGRGGSLCRQRKGCNRSQETTPRPCHDGRQRCQVSSKLRWPMQHLAAKGIPRSAA